MADKIITFNMGEWAPYVSEDQSKKYLAEEIVNEVYAHQGYKVHYEYFPWKRSYINVQNGKANGTFPWYYTPERKKEFIIPKEALLQDKEVFFHLKDNDFHWDNFKDLKKYRIGGVIGFTNVDILQKQGVDVIVLNKDDLNFKMILAGRLDAYPISEFVGYEMLHNIFPPEEASLFTHHPKTLNEGGEYILFSKDKANSQELADAFDRGIIALKSSGRYDEIIVEFLAQIR